MACIVLKLPVIVDLCAGWLKSTTVAGIFVPACGDDAICAGSDGRGMWRSVAIAIIRNKNVGCINRAAGINGLDSKVDSVRKVDRMGLRGDSNRIARGIGR